MNQQLILLPATLQILLTLWAYIRLSFEKSKASRAGQVNEARRALHDDAWPDSVRQINNNIRNQFELPVLFYVLVIFIWLLGAAGLIAQIIAWLFALSRVAHFIVHTGSNYVPLRRRLFSFGALMVLTLCGLTIIKLLVR